MPEPSETDKVRARQLRRDRRAGAVTGRPPWWRMVLPALFLLALIAFIVVMLNHGATVPLWAG